MVTTLVWNNILRSIFILQHFFVRVFISIMFGIVSRVICVWVCGLHESMRKCHVRKCVEIDSNVFRFTVCRCLYAPSVTECWSTMDCVALLWVLRTMSLWKSSTINDDYLSILRCVVVVNANWKLHHVPLLWPLIFGFYWNWNKNRKKKREQETTIEEAMSETHYFLRAPE